MPSDATDVANDIVEINERTLYLTEYIKNLAPRLSSQRYEEVADEKVFEWKPIASMWAAFAMLRQSPLYNTQSVDEMHLSLNLTSYVLRHLWFEYMYYVHRVRKLLTTFTLQETMEAVLSCDVINIQLSGEHAWPEGFIIANDYSCAHPLRTIDGPLADELGVILCDDIYTAIATLLKRSTMTTEEFNNQSYSNKAAGIIVILGDDPTPSIPEEPSDGESIGSDDSSRSSDSSSSSSSSSDSSHDEYTPTAPIDINQPTPNLTIEAPPTGRSEEIERLTPIFGSNALNSPNSCQLDYGFTGLFLPTQAATQVDSKSYKLGVHYPIKSMHD